jgi:lipoprotein-anchoring transpeptidase ErfK/SrfK
MTPIGPAATRWALVAAVSGLLASGCGAAGQQRPASAPPAGSNPAAAPASPLPQAVAGPLTTTPAKPAVRPAVKAAVTPCTKNARARYVFVSLRRQHMWMCAQHRVAYTTAITSGMAGQYTETPTGTFSIQGRNRNTVLTLNTGATYAVKYWIPFQAPLFGFHDSSWQDFPYGSSRYRTDGSHGCVHMPLTAIKFLYNWADIGTTVRITN